MEDNKNISNHSLPQFEWLDILDQQNISEVLDFGWLKQTLSNTPRCYERIEGMLYFIEKLDDPEEEYRSRSWYARAALHFFGTLQDLLKEDFNSMGLAQVSWSEWKALSRDPLIWVLQHLRNYEVHFDFRTYSQSSFMFGMGLDNPASENESELFMCEYTYEEYNSFRPEPKERDPEKKHFDWFNYQVSFLPVKYIYWEAIRRVCTFIASYLGNNMK